MVVNVKELSLLVGEANELSKKRNWDKQDEKRNNFLICAISAVKQGASLGEVELQFHNERGRAIGLPEAHLPKAQSGIEKEARGYMDFVNGEHRNMVEGSPLQGQVGSFSSLGYFVPTDFFPQVFAAMKAADALFSDESVTIITSKNGRPLPIPVAGDTEHTASVISEAGSQTSVDLSSTGHCVLGAYSYASDRYIVSREAFEDVDSAITVTGLLKKFFADKLARGIGKDLVNGTGGGVKPTGLITSLQTLGTPVITASGSSGNDGSTNTGANSIGSVDLSSALSDLDSAYINSNTAWLMNQKTLAALSGQNDKYGNILNLVKYIDGVPTIFGIRVAICPSMDNIGASLTPIVLGDLSYWATRLVVDDSTGIRVYSEAPGLVENGNVGLRCFLRADGGLLYSDTSSPSPFISIRCHS
jgi:HK97 family phage major capsid protein